MRKQIAIFTSLFFLAACDYQNNSLELAVIAQQINDGIDHTQKDKMVSFLEKAEADHQNNAIILISRYYNPKDTPNQQRQGVILAQFIQKNNFCKNPDIHKEVFDKGIKFISIINDKNGVKLDEFELSKASCDSEFSEKENAKHSSHLQESNKIETKEKHKENNAEQSNYMMSEKKALSLYKKKLQTTCDSSDIKEVTALLSKHFNISHSSFCDCYIDTSIEISDKTFIRRLFSGDLLLLPAEVEKRMEKIGSQASKICIDKLKVKN